MCLKENDKNIGYLIVEWKVDTCFKINVKIYVGIYLPIWFIKKRKIHDSLIHHGFECTYYEMKKKYYWISMKVIIDHIIKKCDTCIGITKNKCEYEFIETTRQIKNVGVT